MNHWFHDLSMEACERSMSRVSVAMLEDDVVGFYALSGYSLEPANLSRRQRDGKNSFSHPCTLLGRMAVDVRWQHSCEHVGTALLYHAMRTAYDASRLVASRFIVLDPKEGRASWYERCRFTRLGNGQMVIPFKSVKQVIAEAGDDFFVF